VRTCQDGGGVPHPRGRAILALESDTIAGHTCKVVVLGAGAPYVEALRTAIAERIAVAPQLTCRLGGSADAPARVTDERFHAADHVVAADVSRPVGRDELRALVARLFAERLERAWAARAGRGARRAGGGDALARGDRRMPHAARRGRLAGGHAVLRLLRRLRDRARSADDCGGTEAEAAALVAATP